MPDLFFIVCLMFEEPGKNWKKILQLPHLTHFLAKPFNQIIYLPQKFKRVDGLSLQHFYELGSNAHHGPVGCNWGKGSLTNYVYKRRGVGGQKKSTFCKLSYHRKCKRRGVGAKLYIPSTLNITLIQWHTQLNVCAVK